MCLPLLEIDKQEVKSAQTRGKEGTSERKKTQTRGKANYPEHSHEIISHIADIRICRTLLGRKLVKRGTVENHCGAALAQHEQKTWMLETRHCRNWLLFATGCYSNLLV